ncbi:Opy2 protein [Maudiozyma humilis]|uniref:Opy2 protein n=1 Tax=Maudiozyma humilis TaxID=51915 RepID=A0AAV5S3V3_MAUHU|nr:Opy2 protein [Kazachstania humilis]
MSNSTSDGCVSCGPSPECPACGDDEYCVVTTLTCTQCPTTHCAPRSSSQFSALSNSTANATTSALTSPTSSSNHTTRIVVGSVIGGLAGLVLLVALLVYQWYWKARQRSRQLQLKEGTLGLGLHPEEELDDLDLDSDLDDLDSGDESGDEARDELGSLQEYRQGAGVQPLRGNTAPLRPPMRSSGSGSRHSVSTTGGNTSRHSRISLASNVLPVAYIPGVTNAGGSSTLGSGSGTATARGNGSVSSAANTRRTPTSLNSAATRLNIAGDTGSHITLGSSILGGLDDAWDAASERGSVGGTLDSAPLDSTLGGTLGTVRIGLGNNLTTAIKARAKLVQIHEEGASGGEHSEHSDGEPSVRSSVRSSVHSDMGSFILDVGMDAAPSPTAPTPAANPFDDAFELQSTGTHDTNDTNGAARP